LRVADPRERISDFRGKIGTKLAQTRAPEFDSVSLGTPGCPWGRVEARPAGEKGRTIESYRRRISSEEERGGYLLVEKGALALFPPLGEEFELGGRPAYVRSYPCTCRDAEQPHEHYAIDRAGLRRGQEVAITRISDRVYGFR
jgi:hypothetical protein